MRMLVIGYGNPSRRDDGVGLVVVNGLRKRLGLPDLEEGADGLEDMGHQPDTLFLQQLGPELAEILAGYERVVFVDAHTGVYPELVRRIRVEAQGEPALVSHHMAPGQLLALTVQVFGHAPEADLISIRGFDFDFGPDLSPATASGADSVIEELSRSGG